MSLRRSLLSLAAATLFGCVAGPALTALNPLTGERRAFDAEGDVPAGWIVCAEAERCPPARDCDGLDEAFCLTRPDCSPTYLGVGAYPRECEGADPPRGLCEGDGFAGCGEAAATCDAEACGVAPVGATYLCEDGGTGGVTGRCVLGEDLRCGWEIRPCPPAREEQCAPTECGPAPGERSYACADGSMGGSTGRCLPNDDGTCGWEVRACPASDCGADECGPAPLSPAYLCPDGSRGGSLGVCERSEDGACGWAFRECPSETCPPDACGAPLRAARLECADGSVGGNTGRCLPDDDGTCAWERRECPDACVEAPECALACPPGMEHPRDGDGCLLSCECERVR